VSAPDAPARSGRALRERYTVADLKVLTADESQRFVGSARDPRVDPVLAWELLYRLEPELYDRWARAERLHPAVVEWLPRGLDRIVEVGAGTGRLTLELLCRAREIVAIEPAGQLRELLRRKLADAEHGGRARVSAGYFDALPLPADWADLAVACSVLTPEHRHGGAAGLAELERVCRPGGRVVIVWPNHLTWLADRGYRYLRLGDDELAVEFASHDEAVELTEIFYPGAAAQVRRAGLRRVPFSTLGVNPPRDVAYKVMAA
jgi:SAM-dependent methyltransferase